MPQDTHSMIADIGFSQIGQSWPTGPSPLQSGELQAETIIPFAVMWAALGVPHEGHVPMSFEVSTIAAVAILDASDSMVRVVPPSMNCGYHRMSIIRVAESMVKRMYMR